MPSFSLFESSEFVLIPSHGVPWFSSPKSVRERKTECLNSATPLFHVFGKVASFFLGVSLPVGKMRDMDCDRRCFFPVEYLVFLGRVSQSGHY